MSLLDDAREILKYGPGPEHRADVPCSYCCFLPHQDACVWLSMPKIIEALETVAHIAALLERDERAGGSAVLAQQVLDAERRLRILVMGS